EAAGELVGNADADAAEPVIAGSVARRRVDDEHPQGLADAAARVVRAVERRAEARASKRVQADRAAALEQAPLRLRPVPGELRERIGMAHRRTTLDDGLAAVELAESLLAEMPLNVVEAR